MKRSIMYRKIFKAQTKEDLVVELPVEYLNKQVEVIVFKVSDDDEERTEREANLKEAFEFFDNIHADMSNFKFNRDEANER